MYIINDSYQYDISKYYQRVRAQSERLCKPLSIEDFNIQTMPDVSPAKWHLAHTTWFFETFLLKRYFANYQVYNDKFEYLFNSYYNAVGQQFPRPRRGTLSRPLVQDIYDYRQSIDNAMQELINNTEQLDHDSKDYQNIIFAITLGLHHEQQHQELILTDLKNGLSANPLYPSYDAKLINSNASSSSRVPKIEYVEIKSGVYNIGFEGTEFAFDNEGPKHSVYLNDFKLANRLVTCGEYIEFIEDGGYQRSDLWLSDAWACIKQNPEQWGLPLYWQRQNEDYFYFTLAGLRKVNKDEPVCHVSFYEADAFARWSEKRLPTEAEWEVVTLNQYKDNSTITGNFVDNNRLHPAPLREDDNSNNNVHQLLGDVWEWTQSSYSPYPGYKPFPGALAEYNGKFMCSQLVLRGGSCATPIDHIRSTYRNFFFPCDRWQFSGIRLADSD